MTIKSYKHELTAK